MLEMVAKHRLKFGPMKFLKLIGVLLAMVTLVTAEETKKAPTEITLKSGTVLRKVEIVRYEPGRVILKYAGGIDPFRLDSMAESSRKDLVSYQKTFESAKEEAAASERLEQLKSQARQLLAEQDAKEVEQAIEEKKIRVGMTPEEAARAWGEPIRKNKSGGSYGSTEQWVYPAGVYVYFRDGRLTSWQTP